MPKRLLNMSASDFAATSPMDLKQAILASEGRTIMAENVPSSQFLGGVTNAEIERAAGADLLLFNALDCSIQLLPVFQMISMKTRSLG